MGEVEEWLLDANYFYLANNLHLGGGHEIAQTSKDTIINENNFVIWKFYLSGEQKLYLR